MEFLLDSNICIRFLNDRKSSVAHKIAKTPAKNINLCTVVQTELYYGAYKSSRIEDNVAILARFFNLFRVLPFDNQAALKMAQIRARLAKKGTPIGPYDLQIAAIALVNNLNNWGQNKINVRALHKRIQPPNLFDWKMLLCISRPLILL